MDILTPGYSLDGFFARAADSSERILMLDYDGTLAPFRVERDRAVPYPGVRERLVDIQGDPQTRLIIISGRAVNDVAPLLELDPAPEIWGSHGVERYLPKEGTRLLPLPDRTCSGLAAIMTWATERELGDSVEKKPAGIAFHFRGLKESERNRLAERITSQWSDKAADLGLEWHEFDGGIELRMSGVGKGDAVASILKESGDALIAYLGDDLTDEDAFEALGGKGLRILVRAEMRETKADIRLVPPDELLDFLDLWRSLRRPTT
jgi:trehalose 6-phosphate phosphatase